MLLLNISRSVTIIYSMKMLQYKYIFSANKQILMLGLFRLKIKIIFILHVAALSNKFIETWELYLTSLFSKEFHPTRLYV